MEKTEKKKKSFFARLLIGLFSFIMILVFAAAGLSIYIGIKYNVNVISVTSHLASINKETNLAEIALQTYTDDDLTSANTKKGDISTTTVSRFGEKEVGALLNNLVKDAENEIGLTVGETNLADYAVEVVSVDFSDIAWTQWQQGTMHTSTVLKIETAKLKEKFLSAFPANLLKGFVPNELYLVVDFDLSQSSEGDTLSNQQIKINNLNASQTEQLFLALDMFAHTGASQEFAQKFASTVDAVLFGETNSLFAYLKTFEAKTYVVESTEDADNLVVYNVEPTETRTITYTSTKGATNSNPTTYNITYNTITLAPLAADGYTFLGWFVGDNQVTTINAEDMQNLVLSAHWQLNEYTISMTLRGGEIGALYLVPYTQDGDVATITYTIESLTFALPSPTKTITVDSVDQVLPFRGWDAGDGILDDSVSIEYGSFGNKEYTAYYEGETKEVTVVVDNHTYTTLVVDVGTKLNQATFFDSASVGMSGYSVENWYSNNACTSAFDFDKGIVDNISIYGSWTYLTDNVYFYPYLSEFNAAQTSNNLHLSSREMLIGYIDYVLFYEITNSNVVLHFDYAITQPTARDEVVDAYTTYAAGNVFNSYCASYGYTNSSSTTTNKFYISSVYSTGQASKVVSTEFASHELAATNQPLTQQDYAFKLADVGSREETCEFNVDKVQKTLEVYTSEQLVWALENGYKPVCRVGSNAETVYNKAKDVLREICDDTMDDTQKLERIYQWIVFNTQYDRLAAKLSDSDVNAITTTNGSEHFFKLYDSWFAEGVFNSKIAVCEGFAKAFLIMARIEGIPCIYVTGNGHAWNKVYVGGNWYVVDSTHGNPLNPGDGTEILNYCEFMITDAIKASRGYSTTDYSAFAATISYCALADMNFSINSNNFDLYANSQSELTNILKYVKDIKDNATIIDGATHYTFNVCFDSTSQYSAWISGSMSAAGIYGSYSVGYTTCSNCVMYSISIPA